MHTKNHITVQFPGDLMEYMWMRPNDTGLGVDILSMTAVHTSVMVSLSS